MTKGDFITVVSNLFCSHPQGSVNIFDGLSELYDELMAPQENKEAQTQQATEQGQNG